jgi:succinate dehydrogenase / fumarate reductase membrane anchor subunit
MVEWLGSPLGAVPMLLLIVSTFWHAKLGLQVVVEDYVDDEGLKLFTITLVNFFIVALGATAFFSVLKIAFAGGAE